MEIQPKFLMRWIGSEENGGMQTLVQLTTHIPNRGE